MLPGFKVCTYNIRELPDYFDSIYIDYRNMNKYVVKRPSIEDVAQQFETRKVLGMQQMTACGFCHQTSGQDASRV